MTFQISSKRRPGVKPGKKTHTGWPKGKVWPCLRLCYGRWRGHSPLASGGCLRLQGRAEIRPVDQVKGSSARGSFFKGSPFTFEFICFFIIFLIPLQYSDIYWSPWHFNKTSPSQIPTQPSSSLSITGSATWIMTVADCIFQKWPQWCIWAHLPIKRWSLFYLPDTGQDLVTTLLNKMHLVQDTRQGGNKQFHAWLVLAFRTQPPCCENTATGPGREMAWGGHVERSEAPSWQPTSNSRSVSKPVSGSFQPPAFKSSNWDRTQHKAEIS